jgi:hypothetical protein
VAEWVVVVDSCLKTANDLMALQIEVVAHLISSFDCFVVGIHYFVVGYSVRTVIEYCFDHIVMNIEPVHLMIIDT